MSDSIWFLSFRTGYAQSGRTQYIPLYKEFTQGGVGSLRGYAEQSLYYTSNVTGSVSYVNYRNELDFPLFGDLKGALFIDAANLLVNHYSLGGLLYGVGFGFHYVTPVGPVNFDLGFKIDPPPTASPIQIHFSVGVI